METMVTGGTFTKYCYIYCIFKLNIISYTQLEQIQRHYLKTSFKRPSDCLDILSRTAAETFPFEKTTLEIENKVAVS